MQTGTTGVGAYMTSNYNILLVDDDAWSLYNLENIIAKREDLTIFKAENGLAALAILERERIDFLVTDFLMPGMDGITLMKTCQAAQPSLITVIQSAEHELATAIDAIQSGAFDYVTKPIYPPHLLLTLDKCIEKKLLEHKVAEQSDKLKLLTTTIDQSTVSIVITDRDGCIQYVNPHFCVMTGYTVAEAIGAHQRILKSGDASPEFYQDMWKTILAGKIWKGEIKNRKKNGELFWERMTISPVYNVPEAGKNRTGAGERDERSPVSPVVDAPAPATNERITNFIAIKEDITYEKQLEEALHKAGALQRAIFNSANFSSIATDAKGVIQIFNVGAERMLGYTAAEVMNTITPADISDPQEVIARAAALSVELGTPITPGFEALVFKASRGIEDIYELTYIRKDGSRFPAVVSVTALRDDQDAIIGYLLIGTDNTARKQADEASLKAAQAEKANIAKSEFLANMSHEIRTPLNGVIGMNGLLLDTELNETQRRYAETVRASGESLLGLINNILDYSKIDAGKLNLEILDFDLSSLLDDFASTLAPRAQDKRLEIICAADQGVPVLLRGDPGRLRQILTNLTGNAIKFTHAGEVAIRVSLMAESETDVLLLFSVRDTGIGIAADKIDLIFDKFSQVDASTTRKYGGTGLGLAISKQLAQLMGGEVGIESEEGKGSNFWFTARLAQQAEGMRPEHKPVVTRHLARETLQNRFAHRNARILLAEDSITNQQVALGLLRKLGLSADAVANGAEAVTALETIPYDLVLMDCQMPEMDGYQATARIRDPQSKCLCHTIPIVAVTANAMQGDREKCLQAGMDDYVSKPVSSAALAAVLDKWLPQETAAVRVPAPSGTEGEPVAACTEATETPVFNRAGMMERMMDDEELAREVATGFLGELPGKIALLKSFLESGDSAGIQFQAHAIKGGAATVCGEALRAVAFAMEKAGKAEDVNTARALMANLEIQFDQLQQAMAEIL